MEDQQQQQHHDPQVVIREANEKLENNDLQGAQMVYQTALLTWPDDASFGDDPAIVKHISEGVATLWIEFASLNAKANLFKAATEAFEAGVNCPVAGSMGRVWKEYAKFQQGRNRFKTAQKIYLRALVGEAGKPAAVSNPEEQEELWTLFLEMMKASKNDNTLTLKQLKDAVQKEHKIVPKVEADATPPVQAQVISTASTVIGIGQPPAAKRPKITDVPMPSAPLPPQKPAVTAATVESSASALLALTKNMPPEVTAEWLAMDGDALPTRPEPPLFSPSPPKLGDASGKDLLGTDIALKMIRLLIGKNGDGATGSAILDISRGCWMMTALKEREAAKSIEALDKKLTNDIQKMESELEARLSVAGAALSAVQEVNANERKQFISMCNGKRQQLQALISWEFRHLLVIQQQILTSAGLPTFDGPTVDVMSIYIQSCICSYLHSAYNVRRQIGEKPHLTMLKSQEARLATQQPVPMPFPPHLQMSSNQDTMMTNVNVAAYNYPPPALPQHFPPPPQGGYNYPMMQQPGRFH